MVIKELFKEVVNIDKNNLPHHIALSVEGCREYAKKHNIPYDAANRQKFLNIRNIVKSCVKLGIPLFTFYILPTSTDDEADVVDSIVEFFDELNKCDFITENQVKISVLGKWYSLPGRLVEPIKSALENTKDYDKFFLNLCINYDGQEEIVDAAKLIARQVKAGKLDPESIGKSDIKDNIYASYFLPPDLIIKTGTSKKLDGFLLWDSPSAKVYFSNKPWPDFGKLSLLNAIEFFQK